MARPVKCPYCGSTKTIKRGQQPRQRWQCTDNKHPKDVSRYFYGETTTAKVLLFDIETLPMEFWGWRLWDQITSIDMIKRDWVVLSYAAKWLFQPTHMSGILTPKEAIAYDDSRLIPEIHKLFSEADVIIAHNGDTFDIVRMNTRFLFYDMAPPAPYLTIDTRVTAKKAFGFSSNKLDYLAQYLGLGKKHHTEFELWKRCAAGDKAALAEMLSYNEKDIYLLEDVYVKMRPFIKHPNMSLYMVLDKNEHACPRCQSKDIKWEKYKYTDASQFEAFHCKNCGGWGRAGKSKKVTPSRVI